MEYARITIIGGKDKWYERLEGEEVLAIVEFSIINGMWKVFEAKPVQLPEKFKQHIGRPVLPQHLILV